jgi:hypothetical protein
MHSRIALTYQSIPAPPSEDFETAHHRPWLRRPSREKLRLNAERRTRLASSIADSIVSAVPARPSFRDLDGDDESASRWRGCGRDEGTYCLTNLNEKRVFCAQPIAGKCQPRTSFSTH